MNEVEIYTLLNQYDIYTPQYRTFAIDEPLNVDFYPCVLKTLSSKIVHKSEYGAVKVGISSQTVLEQERDEMLERVAQRGVVLDAEDRFLVSAMIGGEELYVGVVDDSIFGQVILFGKGGTQLELYKDICYIDLYATEAEIIRAIKLTKVSEIFYGFRNSGFTIGQAVAFIQKVQTFVKAHPTLSELDINPLILNDEGFFAVDARIKFHVKPTKKQVPLNFTRPNLFENSKVAIIGVSTNPLKVGYAIAKNALNFTRELYFVNTKGGELFGKPLYQDIREVPGNIDTAVITTPNCTVLAEIDKLITKKIKNIIIITAGFKEVGDYESENRIAELAKQYNFNVVGPNCLGYYESSKSLNITFAGDTIKQGEIALLAQSGAVLTALIDKAHMANIGFSHIVSLGNMVDYNFGDAITVLDSEPNCKYISIYAEGISNGKSFLKALRNTHKKIYLYKSGRSAASQKAAFSHTGNLSGNYAMFKGLVESLGIKVEDNIESLLLDPNEQHQNIVIITNAGGPGTILTDYIDEKGKNLYQLKPEDIEKLNQVLPFNWSKNNPVDIIGDALSDRFEKALDVVDSFDEVGVIYYLITPQFMTDIDNIVNVVLKKRRKKVYPILLGGTLFREAEEVLKDHKILYFTSLQDAVTIF